MYLATDLSDILFGTPAQVMARANLGTLKESAVNIAVHGHNPVLSEVIVAQAELLREEAIAAGAPEGINLVGICCTGLEVMMRHGIPTATNSLSQELAILTGALDAAVVDYQCIMPSLPTVASHYHTAIITTMSIAEITGAHHINSMKARGQKARDHPPGNQKLSSAIRKVNIPPVINDAWAVCLLETIVKYWPGRPTGPA
jgi:carbon-monoxide dehydrogenase catalytic subunit